MHLGLGLLCLPRVLNDIVFFFIDGLLLHFLELVASVFGNVVVTTTAVFGFLEVHVT